MKKTFLLFYTFIILISGQSIEAILPQPQKETVELLKPKLNSDRIEYFFGSFGVDVLNVASPEFPNSRISNLYSVHNGKKIMRTFAIVDFFHPMSPDLQKAHNEIMNGKAIGIALRDNGWTLRKLPVYFGSISLTPALMNWMDEPCIDRGAVHIYKLEVSKPGQTNSHYCTIIEVQNPQYLTEEWLQALNEDQFKEFSIKTEYATDLLSRVSNLMQDFPFPSERN